MSELTVALEPHADLRNLFPDLGTEPGSRYHNVLHLYMLTDDSSSIANAGNTGRIIRGHNAYLSLLRPSLEMDLLIKTRLLNGGDIDDFQPLCQYPLLDERRFRPQGWTPLYHGVCDLIKHATIEAHRWQERGYQTYRLYLVLTDGINEVGQAQAGDRSAADVRRMVTGLRRRGRDMFIGLGVVDNRGTRAQVEAQFRDMGFREPDIRMIDGLRIEETLRSLAATVNLASSSVADFQNLSRTGVWPAPDDPAKNPPAP